MVPERFLDDLQNFDVDFLAPNEYFQGRSEVYSLLTNPSEMYRRLEHKNEHKRKSLLKEWMANTDWNTAD